MTKWYFQEFKCLIISSNNDEDDWKKYSKKVIENSGEQVLRKMDIISKFHGYISIEIISYEKIF